MKVSTSHLEAVRGLLTEQSANLDALTKAATTAEEARDQKSATVRSLQAAFDITASAYASDSDLSVAQLDSLLASVQTIFGYQPAAVKAKAS